MEAIGDNYDVMAEIIRRINCGSAYKAILFSCKALSAMARAAHPDADIKFANHLLTIMKFRQAALWDGYDILANPCMSMENIKMLMARWTYMPRDHALRAAARNPNLTWEFIQANYTDIPKLGYLPAITLDMVRAEPDKWDYEALSRNPNLTWEFVQANSDRPWDYDKLSGNACITWDIVQSNPHISWNYSYMSHNPNITYEMVISKPRLWTGALAKNKNIPAWFLRERFGSDIAMRSPNITWEDCRRLDPAKRRKNPEEYSLELHGYDYNPNLTWKKACKYPHVFRAAHLSRNTFGH